MRPTRTKPRASLVSLALLSLAGCYVLVASPFLFQSDFDDKRSALKREVETGLVSKEAAEASCRSMLGQVDRGHAAPPPYPPESCDFGSFADKRYELTKMAERGQLSGESWRRECRQLAGPDEAACRFDPLGDKVAQWKRLISAKQTTKEAVEIDCRTFLKEWRGAGDMPVRETEEACKF